jgi:cytidylate kinase
MADRRMSTQKTFTDSVVSGAGAPRTAFVIAVDGPAGSGKSSVSKAIARRLHYAYLDTGAAYRALAWLALHRGIDPSAPGSAASLLDGLELRIGTDPDDYRVEVGEADVTQAIRDPQVSARVSAVARIPAVREHVNRFFRSVIAQTTRPGILVEGRDITTVVAPDAPVRILLTADPAVRAARRAAELTGDAGQEAGQALHRRDAADARVVDFMHAAEGVTTVDSTDFNFAATVDAVQDLIEQAGAPHECA